MADLIDQIISMLETNRSGPALDKAILNAAFAFERARVLPPAGWSLEVIDAKFTDADVAALKQSLVAFIERGGRGCWALGKSHDPMLKSTFVQVLRRELYGDASELHQAIIALQNIGECVDRDRCSYSVLDEAGNRDSAKKYLVALE